MSLEVGNTNRPEDGMRNVIPSLASTVFPTLHLITELFLGWTWCDPLNFLSPCLALSQSAISL